MLSTEKYESALKEWPITGRVILAQYDDQGIWVYQAFKPCIARCALEHKRFIGAPDYSVARMSWIKTNFLWMQFRSGWCSKINQENCLAIKLKRSFFDSLIRDAVSSQTRDQVMLRESEVRLQWDPDHDPMGNKCERRAIQLGLRCNVLMQMASGDAILDIVDMTDFVVKQRDIANSIEQWKDLLVPVERPYII